MNHNHRSDSPLADEKCASKATITYRQNKFNLINEQKCLLHSSGKVLKQVD